MRKDASGWRVRFSDEEARQLRASGVWRGRTIVYDATEAAAAVPDQICLRDGVRAISYRDILLEAQALAAGLSQRGLRPGQVVAFQLPNWIEAAVVNIAAAMLGLVVNPIVPIYRDKEVGEILADCGAKVLFVPTVWRNFDHAAMAERVRAITPELEFIVQVRAGAPGANLLRYEDLLRPTGHLPPMAQQDADAIKFVMYTSGTTGRAKGVLHTHNTMFRALAGCMEFWQIGAGRVILMPSPVSHITGYLWGLESPFSWRTPTILMDRWDASQAAELIDRFDVALTVSATPFLSELLEAAAKRATKLPSLRIFACGGASVPADLIRRANDYLADGRAFRVYGATEVLMIGKGFVDAGTGELAAETDGKISDYEVLFVDDAGVPVPDGAEGEIIARGPSQSVGYVDQAETARSFDAQGYFHTGDLGYRTSDGAVVITGRKKDLIIRGGENISAREVEDILLRHPKVAEVAVVAMPHARLGETVCACVVARANPPTLEEILAYLDNIGIARQKLPERLEIFAEFPMTPAGKIKKDILRAVVASRLREEQGFAPTTMKAPGP